MPLGSSRNAVQRVDGHGWRVDAHNQEAGEREATAQELACLQVSFFE
jgi:hypothetical protein